MLLCVMQVVEILDLVTSLCETNQVRVLQQGLVSSHPGLLNSIFIKYAPGGHITVSVKSSSKHNLQNRALFFIIILIIVSFDV